MSRQTHTHPDGTPRWIKNTRTDMVYPYNPEAIKTPHIFEINEGEALHRLALQGEDSETIARLQKEADARTAKRGGKPLNTDGSVARAQTPIDEGSVEEPEPGTPEWDELQERIRLNDEAEAEKNAPVKDETPAPKATPTGGKTPQQKAAETRARNKAAKNAPASTSDEPVEEPNDGAEADNSASVDVDAVLSDASNSMKDTVGNVEREEPPASENKTSDTLTVNADAGGDGLEVALANAPTR